MTEAPPPRIGWLNRNVLGAGLTSFLADACYETATAILAPFLTALGAPPVALGMTEGLADALSSFVKLGSGWYGDRFGHRKAIVVSGYALTAVATACFALAIVWPLVLLGRALAWLGKGIRGPLRNAILAESVAAEDRGKVFGFHRAGDTLGAILGPLLGAGLLALVPEDLIGDITAPYRIVFALTLIPGLGAALAFALLVRERPRREPAPGKLWASITSMPRPFRRFLVGVGVFGAGDFAAALLILAAVELLRPQYGVFIAAQYGALLYSLRNLAHALSAFPVGVLADKVGRRLLLTLGYALGAATMTGFAVSLLDGEVSWLALTLLFALSGVYISIEETLEPALTADFVPDESIRGTAYGVLGAVNGIGDFLSSFVVGLLWTFTEPAYGVALAALFMFVGTLLMARRA